ncbi:DUF4913 domain-containing protein [Clavibacter capsici]|uniref:DUF4913 domain-containing protein n=1 Tax=Clavibacter capsici TaxID=1874630 RepID=UPI0014285CA3|nr:DUF4913 domain-containing protein [Clavibacter capsici]QIS40057.1 DUF4913 domain-containing protein [Clavibacter capsici]
MTEAFGWGADVDAVASADPVHADLDAFVRGFLAPAYRREVSPRGESRWDPEWWRHPEAVARLDALWLAWEALRLEGATGMSVWWRDHADYHLAVLMGPTGPFARSSATTEAGEPLPCAPLPVGSLPGSSPDPLDPAAGAAS